MIDSYVEPKVFSWGLLMSRHIKSCHRQSRECVRPRKLQSQKCQKKVKDRDPTLSVTRTQNWTSSKKPERDGCNRAWCSWQNIRASSSSQGDSTANTNSEECGKVESGLGKGFCSVRVSFFDELHLVSIYKHVKDEPCVKKKKGNSTNRVQNKGLKMKAFFREQASMVQRLLVGI